MAKPIQLVSGLGGAIGCDLRRAQNQLLFVEFSGKLSRLNLYRTATTVGSNTSILKGTWTFDLDSGVEGGAAPNFDIWWEQQTAVLRQMVPQNGAMIANLGVVDFNSLTPDTLQSLPYSTTPITGNNDASNKLVTGDVFAVKTTSGNYAKVKVLAYGYDMQIQWVTYHLDSPYAVLGTGYTQPEDVKASADGAHAYVTERSGDLVRVALTSANRPSATVVCSGIAAPQQMVLDEVHHMAYVVEYASPGKLWQVDLTSGTKSALISNLENAVGVALTADLQFAYVSEQTTGPDGGRVSRYQFSNGSRSTIVHGLTSPFFLTWMDDARTQLLVTERDPANRITLINVNAASSQVIASGVPSRPSSVAMLTPGELLICSDSVIEQLDVTSAVLQPSGPLLMGIGFIPFDRVTAAGLADTTVDPSYFYQVKNTPFGGTLPLMVNHLRAFNDGAAYYRVKVDGVVRSDTWTDEKWNGFEYVAQTIAPGNVAGTPGYYPVRPVSEVFLYLNPALGDLLDSRNLSNGLHTIQLEFVNSAGTLLETSTALSIRVDNNHCVATISVPTFRGTSANATCGVLNYGTTTTDLVSMPFTASHPNGFATFSFSLIRGVNAVALPAGPGHPPTSGPVSSVVSPITDGVSAMLGGCSVAGFAELVYVAALTNNGWGRQSQYDASAAIAFVLAP
jgi:hypothetical protein